MLFSVSALNARAARRASFTRLISSALPASYVFSGILGFHAFLETRRGGGEGGEEQTQER